MVLSLVGCANLESLVHKEENVSRETSLIKIGERQWRTESVKVPTGSVALSIVVRAKGSTITTALVVV